MKQLWEVKCAKCNHVETVYLQRREEDAPSCVHCGSEFTTFLLGGTKRHYKAKDPYDYI